MAMRLRRAQSTEFRNETISGCRGAVSRYDHGPFRNLSGNGRDAGLAQW